MILAGDIGGTKTNLAYFKANGGRLVPVAQRSVSSADYPGLEAIVQEFLKNQTVELTAACFGIAGPVVDGRCQTTNLPWVVDARTLQRTLKLEGVSLINDLEATAYGVQTLPEEAFAVLNAGDPQPHGTIAVIAAGTGLGEAALIWNGQRYQAVASEGGHADFAPRNELEMELLRYLMKQFGRVSYERILSGPGKVNVYQFLKDTGRGEEPAWLTELVAHGDPSPVISEMALNGRSELCVQALKLFTSIYGAEAGNLALKYLARGGVYLGGGIAPKMLPLLQDGTFMQVFADKGRLSELLFRIP
ncbi:MAG: glucokinase, partial [Candidatus Omnitrophica bacterium]|nr:glucokinase [Candidatus Omnitrophota bacterium]